MSKKAEQIMEILKALGKLPFVTDVEITQSPLGVESDVGVLIRVKDKKSSDGLMAADTVSDLQWKFFDESGELPAIFWDWERI